MIIATEPTLASAFIRLSPDAVSGVEAMSLFVECPTEPVKSACERAPAMRVHRGLPAPRFSRRNVDYAVTGASCPVVLRDDNSANSYFFYIRHLASMGDADCY